jgi:hypothetical protein
MTLISRFHALCVAFCFVSILNLSAQETPTQLPSSSVINAPQDFFSFGLSYQQPFGSPYLALQLSPMFSAMYSHKFTPFLEVEAAIHFAGRGSQERGAIGGSMSSVQTGDISAMFTPFAGSGNSGLERLRIGGGISVQNRAFVGTGIFSNAQGQWEVRDIFSSYRKLGATVKLDYIIPLSTNVELGIRAQAHIFEVPPITQNLGVTLTQIPLMPTISLGGFIRFGW